ncbi:MAG: hypothetical protein ACLRT5_21160 [Lachnospiraceae bacterium]
MNLEELREQYKLQQAMLEQQNAYIELQNKRIAEKDAAIADLRKLVDESAVPESKPGRDAG